MSDHDFKAALHKAHVDGNGAAVAEIWREISDGEMSDADTLAWAKEVAVWITSTDAPSCATTLSGEPIPQVKQSTPVSRVARIHAALAVTGWAEPALDSLTDELHILKLAKKGLRPASTIIWWMIAEGSASQGTREEWLDHVAKGVNEVNQSGTKERRGDKMIAKLGLSAQALAEDKTLILIACRAMFKFPKQMYSRYVNGEYLYEPHKYVSNVIQRLQKMGLVDKEMEANDRKALVQFINQKMEDDPPPRVKMVKTSKYNF
jgi:hypothetical protein